MADNSAPAVGTIHAHLPGQHGANTEVSDTRSEGDGSEHDDEDEKEDYDYPDFDFEELRELLDVELQDACIDPGISYQDFYDRFYEQLREAVCSTFYSEFDEEDVESDFFDDYFYSRSWNGQYAKIDPFESSFLRACKPARSGLGCSVDYERCTAKELKRFVRERRLEDPFPSGLTLKYFYIRLLVKADRELQCAFVDLPAEMRLMVYRNLLIMPSEADKKTADVAILRTSKQVYEEAKNVLYDDNVFMVQFEVMASDHGGLRKLAVVHDQRAPAG